MTVIGHSQVRKALETHLPPVSLLLGPPSVGKWTLAQHIVRYHGVTRSDSIFIRKLSAADARNLIRVARTTPYGSPFKAVVIDMDSAQESALNVLLKLLEEPPPSLRVILVTSRAPLPTILSRAAVYRCGLLTDDEVQQVLVASGMDEDSASTASSWGRGSVSGALHAESWVRARGAVLGVLRALAARDSTMLARALRSWQDRSDAAYEGRCMEMFWTWLYEAASCRWRLFSPAESFGMADPHGARRIMGELSKAGTARPRLAVQVTLEAVIGGK